MHAVAGAHAAHADVPFANVPAGHVVAVCAQAAAPAALYAPGAAQGAHAAEELAPRAAENVPAGQGAQEKGAAAPTAALNVPELHSAHEAAPAAEKEPAGQGIGSTVERGQ